MQNILLINASKSFGHSKGQLNNTLADFAATLLSEQGHNVQVTNVDQGYNLDEEVQRFLSADTVIYQMPGWWMDVPWILKKYVDEVFTHGHGSLYASDGRTRSDASKKYGSGGLLQGRNYMLSLTWNAPLEAFTDPDQFFHGVGVDGVYLPFHKANQFIGLSPLPTFICNDVIKQPEVDRYLAEYREHLTRVFA
ncbi:NAD(P)H-dependent oxidoreductase [Symbiopectobacterium purcellii]|uniref:NAD(P)H-dependent oxidoreductase n=1 Tax=Symbiopectobacterium purcellii TaxID=2871826 RepID=A0ABX9AMF8_9ENTR|nr:NAD(P)H-dependent oxidoreductase [Symbiopectobacterium purcellii]QZN96192.1 NAD(P)H-dependent oxidoreductase [Symbiopectobacterium purcellii]